MLTLTDPKLTLLMDPFYREGRHHGVATRCQHLTVVTIKTVSTSGSPRALMGVRHKNRSGLGFDRSDPFRTHPC